MKNQSGLMDKLIGENTKMLMKQFATAVLRPLTRTSFNMAYLKVAPLE
jgi:hypothetical protein